jgi:uncharacterized integral membrane protein
MMHNLNKLFFNIFYNSSLFIILLIGIQNSSSKVKINLLINETIRLPISFIIGTSFISGSIFGSLFKLSTTKNTVQSERD